MVIALDFGHGCSCDGGAVGIITEESVINKVGSIVKEKLEKLGHTIILTRPSGAVSTINSLNQRCIKANCSNATLFISLHANTGGGNGVEVYSYKGRTNSYGKRILENLANLGYNNRGFKDGSNLAVIRGTTMKAILVELFFIDSKTDVSLFNTLGPEKIADSIVSCFKKSNTNNPSANPTLQFGSTGNYVTLLQEKLTYLGYDTYGVDGIFGNNTLRAVKKFQDIFRLEVDGIVGPKTWTKLIELSRRKR